MQKYRSSRSLTHLEKIKSRDTARMKDADWWVVTDGAREDSQGLIMRNVCPMPRSILFTLKAVKKEGNIGVREFNWGSLLMIKARDLEIPA